MKIITYPNPILEKRAKKVKDPLDSETQKVIKQLLGTMEKYEGAGLAAPQIGKSLRICAVKNDESPYILINPKITSYSRESEICEEGCLSFPGKFIPVKRPLGIKIRYLNEKGEKIKSKYDNLLARVIQHEVDHLDGILFIKRQKK